MKFLRAILFLFFSLVSVSCSLFNNDEKVKTVQAIDYSSDMQSEKLNYDNVSLLNPADIVNVTDEYLVISDSNSEGFIMVFKLPELDFLYSWGRQGRGPNEFEFIPLNEINTDRNNIIFYEFGTRTLREYEVNDTSLVLLGEAFLSFDGQTHTLTGITKVNDDLYIAENGASFDNDSFEFIALEPNVDQPLFYFGRFPETQLTGFEKLYEYLKTTAVSSDGDKIAASYFYHNKIKIFDDDENLLGEYVVNDSDTPQSGEGQSFQYRSIKNATDSYMYFMGMFEYEQTINENIETFKTTFEVWDWSGNQVHRAKFDRPIHNFTVSEKHGKIYAYSVLDMQNIYVFDLPEF